MNIKEAMERLSGMITVLASEGVLSDDEICEFESIEMAFESYIEEHESNHGHTSR